MIKSFRRFISEGGNIHVGEAKTSPITVKNRSEQTKDVSDTLGAIHDSFHHEHGQHLFGQGKKALGTGSAYSGSSRHFMDKKIPDDEFKKSKPTVGDIDVQIPKEHGDNLAKHLTLGRQFGKYTVAGVKKHGNEISAVMKHANGEHHQFDFEKSEYHQDEPHKNEQFAHGSSWSDMKAGIKGVHHKVLLHTAGGDHHKFSITHGLRAKTDTSSNPGERSPEGVSKTLFGDKADHSQIHSFQGTASLIKKHIPKEQHQDIYNRFKKATSGIPNTNHKPALDHLRSTLGVTDSD